MFALLVQQDWAMREPQDMGRVTGSDSHVFFGLSSYLVWVGVKFSNAIEEELLINDASQIGSKKFDFSIE